MKFLLLAVCLSASLLTCAHGQFNADFNAFREKYAIQYNGFVDFVQRLTNFLANRNTIDEQNKLFEQGKSLFQVSVNQFSDLTYDEMLARLTGYRPPVRDANGQIPNAMPVVSAPAGMVQAGAPTPTVAATVDWRTKSAVSPVKSQGSCGACWAFTANGALESHNYIKTKKMVILSEQNLVDCTKDNTKNNNMYLSYGCDGGVTSRAFNFIRDQPGVVTQSSYPYTAKSATCKFNRVNVAATDKGFVSLPVNEVKIRDAVANIGPVATALHASKTFMSYKSGIYNEANCPTSVNHAVLIVGYGTEKGVDYWIVKNSWGTGWGEAGYFRIARGSNKCGIASYATYPVL